MSPNVNFVKYMIDDVNALYRSKSTTLPLLLRALSISFMTFIPIRRINKMPYKGYIERVVQRVGHDSCSP